MKLPNEYEQLKEFINTYFLCQEYADLPLERIINMCFMSFYYINNTNTLYDSSYEDQLETKNYDGRIKFAPNQLRKLLLKSQ